MKRKQRDLWILAGLFVLGVLLGRLQTAARNAGKTDIVSSIARYSITPAARVFDWGAGLSADFVGGALHGRRLEEENRQLRAIAAGAANYDADLDRLQNEIEELRKLGNWEAGPGREKVPADVIGYFPHENRITLNVGLDKGLKRGMPVATYEGLVGRIETVDRNTSQVLLITATTVDSRISALVRRRPPNPAPAGLIRGDGPNSLILELADPTATVDSGDIVTTSGFSEEIPRGIVIGKVISVEDDKAFGKRSAIVFPKVALGQVREVLVIK